MTINGLQKMTLLDFPGKVACTVFLGWCDFRCPFCHNWELVDGTAPAALSQEELFSFLKKRQGVLEGVAITGGEPMINKDLPELLRKIRELGYPVKVDTNGNHPDILRTVLEEGLADYIAMDIKNSPELYGKTIGIENFDPKNVVESVGLIMSQAKDYEFRTTVVAQLHDEQSFEGIGNLIEGAKRYYLQKFTDRDTVPFAGLTAPENDILRRYSDIVATYVQYVELRGVD